MIKTLLVLLSACLYGIAYICPIYFWWTVLIFLVPLFYCVAAKPHNIQPLTFTDGVLWSTVAFTLHLSGVLDGLFINAEGPIFLRILPPLLVLLLAITYGILWFAGTIWLSNPSLRQAQGKLLRMTGHMRLAIWVITAWLFFLWMEHCCIFMLGAWEGYLLCNPLVPLVHFPALLYFMPKIGSVLFLLFFVGAQALVAAAYIWRRWCLGIAIVLASVWGLEIFLWYEQEKTMHNTDTLACGSAFFKSLDNITHNGRVIREYCKALLKKYPDAGIIFFPETALRCPLLVGEPDIVALLNQQELDKPITLLMGGYRWDNDIYRNTIYWIHDGKLIDLFDKRHAMAFTERLPQHSQLANNYLIKETYFKTHKGITAALHPRPLWKISPHLTVIPYICSELFFNNSPDHSPEDGAIIVALCNDNWLSYDFMRYQMLMGARYRAIHWQIPIIYVAHFYQALCEPWGDYYPLKAFDHNQE